jgi:excisionase family DNA binding protein
MATHGLPDEYGIADLAADHALASRLPLEALIRLRCQLRHLDADIEAAIALRGQAVPAANADEDRYLTMAEVAERTGLSLSHVYEMARFGKIPARRMGRGDKGRAYRVLLSDLRAWEQGQNLVVDAMKQSQDFRNGRASHHGQHPQAPGQKILGR